MANSERIFGRIFFPNSPEKTEGAWLTITSTSILIEVPISTSRYENWPIILGEFHGMDEVTFVNCYGGLSSVGAGGSYAKVHASYLIKGKHIEDLSKLKFRQLTLISPALNNWIREAEFIEEIDEATYKIPKFKEIAKTSIDNIELTIDVAHYSKLGSEELHVQRVCTVCLKSNDDRHIDLYSEIMRHLKKLILFLTNKDPEYSGYYLRDENDREFELMNTLDSLNEEKFTQSIDISYFLIKESSFANLIERWFRHKKLYAVIDLVLEKCFNIQMSIPGFFLNVCVAIESFHDKFGDNGKEKIDPLRSAKREQIISLIENKELLDWFKAESQHLKYPTLKERLNGFKNTLDAVKNYVFPFSTEDFISRTIKTRNDMAHSGKFSNHFNQIELFLAAKVLEFTIRLEILKLMEIDIDNKKQSLILRANRGIRSLASMNKYPGSVN